LFSPIIQYGTYTYKQIMLDPLAKALAAALRTVSAEGTLWPMPNLERPRVYFALQGEWMIRGDRCSAALPVVLGVAAVPARKVATPEVLCKQIWAFCCRQQ
jgi:hypothetical protein